MTAWELVAMECPRRASAKAHALGYYVHARTPKITRDGRMRCFTFDALPDGLWEPSDAQLSAMIHDQRSAKASAATEGSAPSHV